MTQPARLIPRSGIHTDQEYTLSHPTTTIGREPINEIPLIDSEISRRHARIVFDGHQYVIEDLGSTNGTFVNGVEIRHPTVLTPGATIDFGDTQRFTFVIGNPAAAGSEATMIDGAGFDEDATNILEAGLPNDPFVQNADATQIEAFSPPQSPAPPLPLPPESSPFVEIEPEPETGRSSRTLLGCGCATIGLIVLIIIALFILDAFAPTWLYCTALRPLTEAAAESVGQIAICP